MEDEGNPNKLCASAFTGEPEKFVDHRIVRKNSLPVSRNKEVMLPKRKRLDENIVLGILPENSQSFSKVTLSDDDQSNRSSSESAISNSESCTQFGSTNASDLTGPAQSVIWDTSVPSRKRTCITRSKPSAVKKLTKDLYTILQEQQSSCFSGSTEEDLLLECDTPIDMGHGSVLILHPGSIGREEESEASTLSINNKRRKIYNVDSRTFTPVVHNKDTKPSMFPRVGKTKVPTPGTEKGSFRRDKFQQEKFQLLGSPHSPLLYIKLKDVLNFEVFTKQLTSEEQLQLQKYLPFVDGPKSLDGLQSFLTSSQFLESTASFQHLLTEGVFDVSSMVKMGEDGKTLKRLTLFNLTNCKWIEHYRQIKERKVASGVPCSDGASRTKINITNEGSGCDDLYFGPRSLFTMANYGGDPPKSDSFFAGEGRCDHDQDLLLEVRSNCSFPQAELLLPAPTSTISQQASNNSSYCLRRPSNLR